MRIRQVPFLGADLPMYDLLRLFQVRFPPYRPSACSAPLSDGAARFAAGPPRTLLSLPVPLQCFTTSTAAPTDQNCNTLSARWGSSQNQTSSRQEHVNL